MKYLKVFFILVRYNLVREMEFRGSFFLLMVVDTLWVAFQVLLVELYFQFTPAIFDWNKSEVFVLMGLFRVVKGILDVFLRPNIHQLPLAVNRGELDYLLTKPINSFFLVSSKRHAYTEASTIIWGTVMLIYGLLSSGAFNWADIFWILFTIPFGILMFYSLLFSFATLSLLFHRLQATYNYYDILSNLFRFPTDFLGFQIRELNLILLPLAAVVTIPAKFIIGKSSIDIVLIGIVISLVAFLLTYRFWFFALRRYSSASS